MNPCRLSLISLILFSLCIALAAPSLARLPSDPYQRLLYRLDHAPVNLEDLEKQANSGLQVEGAASQFAAIMGPVTPVLEGIAGSKTLSFLGQIPYIGGPVQAIRLGLTGTAEASRGFQWMMDQEHKTVQPLSRAARACAQLQRSRSRSDLPEAVAALDSATGLLAATDDAIRLQDGKVRRLSAALAQLDPMVQKLSNATGEGSLSVAAKRLTEISGTLETGERPLRALRTWARRCQSDAHLALVTPSEPAPETPAANPATTPGTTQPSDDNPNSSIAGPVPGANSASSPNAAETERSQTRLIAYVFFLLALLGFGSTFYLWRSTRRRAQQAPAIRRTPAPQPSSTHPPIHPPIHPSTPASAWLEVTGPAGEHHRYPVTSDSKTFIGRLPAAHLRIEDEQVSGLHAAVEGRGGDFSVADLESSNGTRVNGTRVVNVPLQDNDAILVGSTTITFHRRPSA